MFKCCQIVSGGPSSGISPSAFVYVLEIIGTGNHVQSKRGLADTDSGKTLFRTSTPNPQNGDEDVVLRYVAAADSVPKNLKLRHRLRPPGYVNVMGLSRVNTYIMYICMIEGFD